MAIPMTHKMGRSTWNIVITAEFHPLVVALAIVPIAIGPRMATSKNDTAMMITSLTPNPIFVSPHFNSTVPCYD